MPTPESRVKLAVRRALARHNVHAWPDIAAGRVENYDGFYYMPVAGPYSVHGVHDFVGCWNGQFFSIETKAPDNPEDATPHQAKFHLAVTAAGGYSFVGVRDASVVEELAALINAC